MPGCHDLDRPLHVESAIKELEAGVGPAARERAEASMAKARTRDSLHAFDKVTHVDDGRRRIISDPALVQPNDELYQGMDHDFVRAVIRSYRRTLPSDRRHLLEDFRLADVRREVVGVGSVGRRAWILLMHGRDDTDPLFLQAKEANASVLEAFVGRSDHRSHGERVVHGQHLMQDSSDIFLGWEHVQGVDGVEQTSTSANSVTGRAPRSSRRCPRHHGLLRPALCRRTPGRFRSREALGLAEPKSRPCKLDTPPWSDQ